MSFILYISYCLICSYGGKYILKDIPFITADSCKGSNSFKPSVTVFAVGLVNTCCNLCHLSRMSYEEYVLHTVFQAFIQHVSYEVTSPHCLFLIKIVFLYIIKSVISWSKDYCLIVFLHHHVYLNSIGFFKSLFRHGFHNSSGSYYGNSSNNSKPWIECFSRQLFTLWNP